MSKVDKQALRELAEKATPGAWGKDGVYVCTTITAGETIYVQTWDAVAESHQESNAQFIAAANPAAILALLDEIKTLEGLYHMHRETEERQMIELRAEVAKLREIAMRLIDLQNSGRGAGQAFELWNDVADQARQALGLEVRRG